MEVFVINRAMLSVVIGVLCLSTAGICQDEAAKPKTRPELRGMWVTAWETGLLTPAQCDETIELARKANLNALFVQVRKAGDSLYKSAYEPKAENLPDPNFDALEYIIKRAHASGIEVHAWVNTYKIWQGSQRPKSPDHAFNKHPEWINRNDEGLLGKSGNNFGLDPGIKEVQEYLYKIYMDVVKKYDVDGIHFDYVRYWDPKFGYSDLAVERYKKETGAKETPYSDDPQWCQWRRDRVTDLVRQVYEGTKALKPWMKVTGSVVCSQALTEKWEDTHPRNLLLQDWERWTREGIIDAVVPMNYKSQASEAELFSKWTTAITKWRHKRHAYNGLTVNTTTFPKQIEESREKGTDGYVGFAFNSRLRSGIVDILRDGVYKEWAPVPPMPWKPARKTGGPIVTQDPKELYEKGIASASANDLDSAIILLKRAIEKDINYAEAYYRLGRCYLRKGMKNEAVEQFKQVLEIDPSNKDAQEELRKIAG